MRAGTLRNRLVLQSKVETRGPSGGVSTTWATQFTVWGGIHPISGKEYTAIQQTQNEAEVKIVIRYQSSIDETWRVVNGGRAYAIESIINENDRDRMMTLMCLQGVKEAADLPSEGIPAFALYDVDGNALQFVDGTYWETVD
jgi:SPP1 family predicted phage head-tail adaptor